VPGGGVNNPIVVGLLETSRELDRMIEMIPLVQIYLHKILDFFIVSLSSSRGSLSWELRICSLVFPSFIIQILLEKLYGLNGLRQPPVHLRLLILLNFLSQTFSFFIFLIFFYYSGYFYLNLS